MFPPFLQGTESVWAAVVANVVVSEMMMRNQLLGEAASAYAAAPISVS